MDSAVTHNIIIGMQLHAGYCKDRQLTRNAQTVQCGSSQDSQIKSYKLHVYLLWAPAAKLCCLAKQWSSESIIYFCFLLATMSLFCSSYFNEHSSCTLSTWLAITAFIYLYRSQRLLLWIGSSIVRWPQLAHCKTNLYTCIASNSLDKSLNFL